MHYALLAAAVGAFLLGLVLVLAARYASRRIGFTDKPGGRKQHDAPVALGGGYGWVQGAIDSGSALPEGGESALKMGFWFLIALAMREIKEAGQIANVMSWATNIFLLPFLIFSMNAGWLADHFSKRNVLMVSKACVVGAYQRWGKTGR